MQKAAIMALRAGLPRRLAELRGDRSQRQFALAIGTSQQNINRFEAGGQVPGTDFLILVATRCQCSLDWLVLGQGKAPKLVRDRRGRPPRPVSRRAAA